MYQVATTQGRIDLAQARAGLVPLKHITHIALGTGGHALDDPSTPVPPTADDLALETEIVRKAVSVSMVDSMTVRYSISIAKIEQNGTVFTEAGLFDEGGVMVARQTFSGKTKEADIIMNFDWDEPF